VHPVRHRFVASNRIRMHLAEQGEGPLVVLCHGWPESWYSWRHQMAALADAGYRAVAPDQRGYGQTDAPEAIEAYHILHQTADIAGIVHALGEEQAVIAGHDWGSPVAWYFARLRPDMFRRLILLSVPNLQRNWNDPRPTDAMRLFEDADHEFYQSYFQEPGTAEAELEADVRASIIGLFNDGFGTPCSGPPVIRKGDRLIAGVGGRQTPADWLIQEDIDFYVQEYSRTGFRGGLNWYRTIDRLWEVNAVLSGAKVSQPSPFVAGEDDTVVRDMYTGAFNALEKTMPGLTRKILLPRTGYWVQQERPAEVSGLMLDFVRQTSS
jgi:pimeloyl-ACP methyl ester carboxylesterase